MRPTGSLLFLLITTGCVAAPSQGFLHEHHRARYMIRADDLTNLRFYISQQVLAHPLDAPSDLDPTDSVVILPRETPGMCVETGSNWLRVSFDPDGAGALFVADPTKGDDLYWLATVTGDRGAMIRAKDLPDAVLVIGGIRYQIIDGAGAYLLVDRDDLEDLIESRRHLEGR